MFGALQVCWWLSVDVRLLKIRMQQLFFFNFSCLILMKLHLFEWKWEIYSVYIIYQLQWSWTVTHKSLIEKREIDLGEEDKSILLFSSICFKCPFSICTQTHLTKRDFSCPRLHEIKINIILLVLTTSPLLRQWFNRTWLVVGLAPPTIILWINSWY